MDTAGLAWPHARLKAPLEEQAELMGTNTLDLSNLGGTEEPHASIGGVFNLLDDQRILGDPKLPVVVQGDTDGGQLGVDGRWAVVQGSPEVLDVVLDVPLVELVEILGHPKVLLSTFDAAGFYFFSRLANPSGVQGVCECLCECCHNDGGVT